MTSSDLAVVIPAWNEEKLLTECIDSVKPLTNNILVCDGAYKLYGDGPSQDKTLDIAYCNQCFVIEYDTWDTEAKKREHLVKSALMLGYNWCLFLDADERLEFPIGVDKFKEFFKPNTFNAEAKWGNVNIWRPEHKHHLEGFNLPRLIRLDSRVWFKPPMDFTVFLGKERIAYLDGEPIPEEKKNWFFSVSSDLIRIRHDRHLRPVSRIVMSGEYQQKRVQGF